MTLSNGDKRLIQTALKAHGLTNDGKLKDDGSVDLFAIEYGLFRYIQQRNRRKMKWKWSRLKHGLL